MTVAAPFGSVAKREGEEGGRRGRSDAGTTVRLMSEPKRAGVSPLDGLGPWLSAPADVVPLRHAVFAFLGPLDKARSRRVCVPWHSLLASACHWEEVSIGWDEELLAEPAVLDGLVPFVGWSLCSFGEGFRSVELVLVFVFVVAWRIGWLLTGWLVAAIAVGCCCAWRVGWGWSL